MSITGSVCTIACAFYTELHVINTLSSTLFFLSLRHSMSYLLVFYLSFYETILMIIVYFSILELVEKNVLPPKRLFYRHLSVRGIIWYTVVVTTSFADCV